MLGLTDVRTAIKHYLILDKSRIVVLVILGLTAPPYTCQVRLQMTSDIINMMY